MPIQKVRIRGLVQIPALLLGLWGSLVAPKGVYDLLWGEPEANLYAPRPWAFVSREAWLRYASFELAYGVACLALAVLAWKYARKLPVFVERPAPKSPPLFP